MHRFRIVYHAGDPFRFECSLQIISGFSVTELYCVLRPAGVKTFRYHRSLHLFSKHRKFFRIPVSNLVYIDQLIIVECPELYIKNCRLDRIKSRIQSDSDIIVFHLAFAMYSDRFKERCDFVIISEDRSPVTIASEWLCRKKRSRAYITKTACDLAFDASTEALSAVLQHFETVFVCHSSYCCKICRKSKKIDRYYCLWFQYTFI